MNYYVYILTNKNHTVLYTGVTNDLIRRVYEHKQHADKESFTAKYKVTKLVYYEYTGDVRVALEREKQIKSWNRKKQGKADQFYESFMGRALFILDWLMFIEAKKYNWFLPRDCHAAFGGSQ